MTLNDFILFMFVMAKQRILPNIIHSRILHYLAQHPSLIAWGSCCHNLLHQAGGAINVCKRAPREARTGTRLMQVVDSRPLCRPDDRYGAGRGRCPLRRPLKRNRAVYWRRSRTYQGLGQLEDDGQSSQVRELQGVTAKFRLRDGLR